LLMHACSPWKWSAIFIVYEAFSNIYASEALSAESLSQMPDFLRPQLHSNVKR
jgi:hypothetical protein